MKFKTGDRVRTRIDSTITSEEFRGLTGVVQKGPLKTQNLTFVCLDIAIRGCQEWNIWTNDLELISKSEPTLKKEGSELPPGYTRTSDGFITNPDNWKLEKRLI